MMELRRSARLRKPIVPYVSPRAQGSKLKKASWNAKKKTKIEDSKRNTRAIKKRKAQFTPSRSLSSSSYNRRVNGNKDNPNIQTCNTQKSRRVCKFLGTYAELSDSSGEEDDCGEDIVDDSHKYFPVCFEACKAHVLNRAIEDEGRRTQLAVIKVSKVWRRNETHRMKWIRYVDTPHKSYQNRKRLVEEFKVLYSRLS